MASIAELKTRLDLHEVARRLGLKRPQEKGHYKSPHHDDKNPSLAIPASSKTPDRWKDYSEDVGGDVVDLVCYVNGLDTSDAVKWLHEEFGIPYDKPDQPQERRQRSKAEWIADNCRSETDKAVAYLVQERAVAEEVAKRAVNKGAVGWNTWTSPKLEAGNVGYGGPAVAFFVRDIHSGRVVAVDLRYQDPELNGGVKTQTQGEKFGYPWFLDAHRLKKAHTVYLVESSINALAIESCGMPGVAALSIRGTGNAANVDLSMLRGKRVILCMDDDEPNDKGICPGAKAAWTLHERCTALDIAALMVDWHHWRELDPAPNDVADILKEHGADTLRPLIRERLEPWIIPGLPGDYGAMRGKSRVFLPPHDYHKYWLFRAKEDFTTFVSKIDKDDDGEEKKTFQDLCGFRVAGVSRITIASATSTMTGEENAQPKTLFSCSVQTPRHGARLLRRVFDDETLHNIDHWKKFGPVFSPANFSRMLTILERSAHLGAREAVNFVGLAWKGGQLVVNEGPDTYFEEPTQQCPYHNLMFPSGSPADAARVVQAYQETFTQNAAAILLTWALGGHLKPLLGFWPHTTLQADKGAGKSTVIKRLERTIAFQMFSGQSLQTEFRLLTSISCTSHPVGWEELSARGQNIIDRAVGMLQESYQYTVTRRGSDMKEFILSAPVLLAGEDVPVQSLTGKLVRTSLRKKGPLLPDDLPRFPVRQWLEFLSRQSREEVKRLHRANHDYCTKHCRATGRDEGAKRMVENYAAVMTAWALLAEFADLASNQGNLVHDLVREMNEHIAETSGDREPWVWIVDILLAEIGSGKFRHPFEVKHDTENRLYLAFVPRDVIHHLRTEPSLRASWDGLPVKSKRIFKKQLIEAGVVCNDDISFTKRGQRTTHAIALDAEKLAEYGLHVAEPQAGYAEAG